MAASVLKLLAGVVESLVAKKPPSEIAKSLGVEFPELRLALQQTLGHTWRGKLIRVLADPEFRQDLIPYYTQLARLEEQYGVLMNQGRRAEQICHDYRAHPQGYNFLTLLKAETFANRVHSQSLRVLQNIQKTELLLAKAEKTPPQAPALTPPYVAGVAPRPELNPEDAPQQTPAESTTASDVAPFYVADVAPRPELSSEDKAPSAEAISPPPVPDPQSLTPTFPNPEQFKRLILKHRHRIKDTRAEDRPALIARLIEQDRKQNQPDPHQNGRHAA